MNKQELSVQERNELHKSIWAISNELRGSVDGWDFKSYVLGFMFYRYISENLTAYINKGEHEAGDSDFDYAKIKDDEAEEAREDLVQEKGFFILPSELFCNVCKNAKTDENLNETLQKVFKNIEASSKGTSSERNFSGLFDDIDVNSNKLGSTVAKRNEKLTSILNRISEMKLGNCQDNSIDAFGDAYEYLMGMYASSAGKSGGEYFTPQEVSELLTKIAIGDRKEVRKVYDPTCGSGSLLLQAIKVIGKDNIKQKKELILSFVNGLNEVDDVMTEWRNYIVEAKEKALKEIIDTENLKEEETKKFVNDCFKNGEVKDTGTEIGEIFSQPMSRFRNNDRAIKKRKVISKIKDFFEKFYGM